ncbi:MAG TPA: hypothetical protein PLX03_05790 [Candidatus Hydrogenedentes bacterium]|nr:hypothetical protein [Candidatus Hydrogenedentota bacterium]
MAAIGVFFYGKMRQMKDYFSGGNAIPWWLSGVSFYMSSFSVAAFVFYPSLCYRFGFVGVTLLWVAIPATLFSALLFATRWRRARINSPVEYLESRYSPLLRQIFAWQGIPVRIIDDGMKLLATATFISLCAGIPPAQSVLWTGGIILLTTFLGGLWAVAVTDFIQFVVLTAAVLLLLPLSIAKAGGIGTLVSALPEGFFQLTTPEYGWGYVLSLVLMYALAWSSINWSLIQRYYCVPRERDALKVGGLVVLLYVIGPPLMFFPAMAARQFLPNLDDAGHVYPLLCTVLLPPGIMGLAVAAMFAATMSTLSSDYNVCASVLTNDVYRRLFRPRASERELVVVGRALTILVGLSALGVGWALSSGKAENLFRVMVSLFSIATAPVAIPMLLGLSTRKVSNTAALAGFLTGTAAGLALFYLSRQPSFSYWGITWDAAGSQIIWRTLTIKMETAQFYATCLGTLIGTGFGMLLSSTTSSEQVQIDLFMARLKTPIGLLPEDQMVTGESAFSPYPVASLSVAAIGGLMLLLLPFLGLGNMTAWLNGGLGLFFLLAGIGVYYKSRRVGTIPEPK